ncbi:4Fe-4S binding protein [Hungatella effluvii]|nr:4Fe-4S binding protein [Hungatella effluvii]
MEAKRGGFSYGGAYEEVSGFSITDGCIKCGRCTEACPQK